MGVLSRVQIAEMGFAHVGEGARLSDKASYYSCSRISIRDNTRIDDFCILSGVHLGTAVSIGALSLVKSAHTS